MPSPYQRRKQPPEQRIPEGTWSGLNFDAMARAELMMMRAIDDIRMGWAVRNEELTLEHLNREKWLDMIEGVSKDAEASAQLDETLRTLLIPIIQQAMMPPAPGEESGARGR